MLEIFVFCCSTSNRKVLGVVNSGRQGPEDMSGLQVTVFNNGHQWFVSVLRQAVMEDVYTHTHTHRRRHTERHSADILLSKLIAAITCVWPEDPVKVMLAVCVSLIWALILTVNSFPSPCQFGIFVRHLRDPAVISAQFTSASLWFSGNCGNCCPWPGACHSLQISSDPFALFTFSQFGLRDCNCFQASLQLSEQSLVLLSVLKKQTHALIMSL